MRRPHRGPEPPQSTTVGASQQRARAQTEGERSARLCTDTTFRLHRSSLWEAKWFSRPSGLGTEEEGAMDLCWAASNFTLGCSAESSFHTCWWFETHTPVHEDANTHVHLSIRVVYSCASTIRPNFENCIFLSQSLLQSKEREREKKAPAGANMHPACPLLLRPFSSEFSVLFAGKT